MNDELIHESGYFSNLKSLYVIVYRLKFTYILLCVILKVTPCWSGASSRTPMN